MEIFRKENFNYSQESARRIQVVLAISQRSTAASRNEQRLDEYCIGIDEKERCCRCRKVRGRSRGK